MGESRDTPAVLIVDGAIYSARIRKTDVRAARKHLHREGNPRWSCMIDFVRPAPQEGGEDVTGIWKLGRDLPPTGASVSTILHGGFAVGGTVIVHLGELFLDAGSNGYFNFDLVSFWRDRIPSIPNAKEV